MVLICTSLTSYVEHYDLLAIYSVLCFSIRLFSVTDVQEFLMYSVYYPILDL